MDILEKYKIDPYKFLGLDITADDKTIKKVYKEKAKLLHPDKNNGKTEVQFKILYLSYKYVLSQYVQAKPSTFEELKNNIKNDEEIVYNQEKNIYNTNFEDSKTRNELFADDTINIEDFQKEMERTQGLSTTYTAENFYNKEVLNTMKTKGKFDREKFNAYFLKLKKQGKIENQLIMRVKVLPHNEKDDYVKVNSFNGNIVNSVNKKKLEFKEQKISNEDICKLQEVSLNDINSLIKENRKNTGKMTKKRVKELEEKMKSPIKINENLSFDEMQEKMILEKHRQLEEDKKNQREYVNKNKRIFMNSIQY